MIYKNAQLISKVKVIMNDEFGNVWIGRIYLKLSASKSRKPRKFPGMIYGHETQIINVFYMILLRNQCDS